MFKGLKSLLVGILGGTAIGVLFAPTEGKKMRSQLKEEVKRGGTGLKSVKDTLKGMGEEIEKYYEEVADLPQVKKAVSKAKSKVKKVAKKVTQKASQKTAKKNSPTKKKTTKKSEKKGK